MFFTRTLICSNNVNTHSVFLTEKEEPGGLQFRGHKELDKIEHTSNLALKGKTACRNAYMF